MNMKQHILAALGEMLAQWDAYLAGLDETRLTAARRSSALSLKDELAHLWAWQQRTLARLEAARLDQEPRFPEWLGGLDIEAEPNTDRVNAWIYETYRHLLWATVYQNWQTGFQRVLELAGEISERDLLDPSRYAWMDKAPLALILLGTYDHHQEHFEKLDSSGAEN